MRDRKKEDLKKKKRMKIQKKGSLIEINVTVIYSNYWKRITEKENNHWAMKRRKE